MNYHPHIIRQNEPCWYELGWLNGQLIWRVHKDFWNNFSADLDKSPFIQFFQKQFGELADWRSDYNKDWGFGGFFQFQGIENDFYVYAVDPPVIKTVLDKTCEKCNGSGEDSVIFGNKCMECSGGGKEQEIKWYDATRVSANHTILTSLLFLLEQVTSCDKPQLLTVQTATESGMHGGSLSGRYSMKMVEYLADLSKDLARNQNIPLPVMVKAMEKAYDKMWGLRSYDKYSIWANIAYKGGWVNVSCPGDACNLHPANGDSITPGEGYEFSCHNVDTALQQFTLLASLGALHDGIRRGLSMVGEDFLMT